MLRIKRVHTPALREQVFAMRYRAYRRENAINESADERFEDQYDSQPNHVLWALTENENVIGSVRTTLYKVGSLYKIPEMNCYASEISSFASEHDTLLSPNRFVIDKNEDSALTTHEILLLVMRCYVLVAEQYNPDWVLLAARKNHLPIYKRLLRLEKVSDEKIYPNLTVGMCLTATKFHENIEQVLRKTPQLKPKGYERIFFDENYRDIWEIGLPVEL